MHVYIHTQIHTYMDNNIHIYIYIYIWTLLALSSATAVSTHQVGEHLNTHMFTYRHIWLPLNPAMAMGHTSSRSAREPSLAGRRVAIREGPCACWDLRSAPCHACLLCNYSRPEGATTKFRVSVLCLTHIVPVLWAGIVDTCTHVYVYVWICVQNITSVGMHIYVYIQ
jgi:hypothetical protein